MQPERCLLNTAARCRQGRGRLARGNEPHCFVNPVGFLCSRIWEKLTASAVPPITAKSLDPAFAPGISRREPGGMSVREAIAHLHAITGKIVGADIVEYNPAQDNTQITATVAAKLLKEILGKMILN